MNSTWKLELSGQIVSPKTRRRKAKQGVSSLLEASFEGGERVHPDCGPCALTVYHELSGLQSHKQVAAALLSWQKKPWPC